MENPSLRQSLRRRIEQARRVAVLAVGSSDRGDDAVGPLVAEALKKRFVRRKTNVPVEFFIGESVPENLTGEIRRFQPSHLILLDAADFAGEPGSVRLLDPDVPTSGISASTHSLPLSVLVRYLSVTIPCEVLVLGVQVSNRALGGAPSNAAREAAERLADLIADVLT